MRRDDDPPNPDPPPERPLEPDWDYLIDAVAEGEMTRSEARAIERRWTKQMRGGAR